MMSVRNTQAALYRLAISHSVNLNVNVIVLYVTIHAHVGLPLTYEYHFQSMFNIKHTTWPKYDRTRQKTTNKDNTWYFFKIGPKNLWLACQERSEKNCTGPHREQKWRHWTSQNVETLYVLCRGWTGHCDDWSRQISAWPSWPLRPGRRRLSRDEHHWNQDGAGRIASLLVRLRVHGRTCQGLQLDRRSTQPHTAQTEPGTSPLIIIVVYLSTVSSRLDCNIHKFNFQRFWTIIMYYWYGESA